MRIDNFLSINNICSRSEAQAFMKIHCVTVNGIRITDKKIKINENIDKVYIDSVYIFYKFPLILALNKKPGYISSTIDEIYPSVLKLLEYPYNTINFVIVGRLDVDTSGLLLLTNDGSLVHKIINPTKEIEKEYEVVLSNPLSKEDIKTLLNGVTIADGKDNLYKAYALDIKENPTRIVLNSGKFHQVKRMFEAVNNKVLELKRIRVGKLHLDYLGESLYKEVNLEDII